MNRNTKIVFAIFLLTLILRLYFVFQTPYFSDDSAYFSIRQTESILESGNPVYQDDLSYSGKRHVFPPLFHYFISFFALIFGDMALKVVPELLIASLVFVVYLIVKELTDDRKAILFSSFIAGFIPVSMSVALNNISTLSLALPLTFLALLAFIKINEKKYLNLFVILSIILPLIHPISFLVAISFLFYLLISKSEDLRIKKLTKEAVFFFVFSTLFMEFLIYKEAFLKEGFNVVKQNIPAAILDKFFLNIDLGNILIGLGVVPLLFALVGIFFGVFKHRRHEMVLFASVLLSTLLLLLFKLINFGIGVLFLSIAVTVLSSVGFEKFFKYLAVTKFERTRPVITAILFLIIIMTLVFPAYGNGENVLRNTISDKEFSTLMWIKENTEKDAVVFSSVEEGNYISGIAKKKNVIDRNFLLAEDIDERYGDVEEFFTTTSITKATNTMKKYNVRYVYISERTEKIYNRENFNYLEDRNCFRRSYGENGAEVHKIRC